MLLLNTPSVFPLTQDRDQSQVVLEHHLEQIANFKQLTDNGWLVPQFIEAVE